MAAESLDFVKEVVRKVWGKFIEHFDARTNVDSLFSQKLIDESTMHVILAAKATKDANRAFLLYLLDHATTDSLKTLRKLLCDTSGTFQRHGSLARSLEGPLKLGKIPLPSPVAVRRVANGGSRPSSPQSSISEHTHTVISEGDQTSRLGAVAALDLHIYKDPYQLSPQSSYSEDYLNEDKIDLRVQDSFLCVLAQVAKILNKFFNDLKTVLQRYLKDERRPFDQLDPEYIDSAADIQAIFRKIQIEDFWLNTSPLLRLINVVSHKASRERAIKLLDKYHEDLKSLSTVVLLKHIPKHDISDDRLERWRSSVEHLAVTFDLEFENFQLSDLFAQQEFLSRIFKIPPSAFSYLSSGPTASTVVHWALHISASQAFEILERAQCAFWRLKEHLIIKVEIEGTFQFHLRGKHLPHLIKKALHRNQEFLTFTEHISHQFLALVDYSHFKRRDFHQRGGYQPIGVDPEAVGSDVHETESRTPIGSTLSEKYADVQMDQEPNSASTKMTKLGTFWSRTVTSPLSKLFAQFAEVIRQPPQPVHDDGPGGGPTEEEHSDPAPAKTMRPVSYSKGSGSSSFPSSSDGPIGGPKGSLSGVASVSSPSLPSKIPAVEGVYAKPTAPELWKHAGQHMHSEWYKFGVVLQVSENILKSIKTANSSVTDDCFLILSQQWLRKGNGTGEAPRTWRTVLEAVRRCGFPDLAKEVKKLIHQGKLNEPEPSGSDYSQPPSDVLRPQSALAADKWQRKQTTLGHKSCDSPNVYETVPDPVYEEMNRDNILPDCKPQQQQPEPKVMNSESFPRATGHGSLSCDGLEPIQSKKPVPSGINQTRVKRGHPGYYDGPDLTSSQLVIEMFRIQSSRSQTPIAKADSQLSSSSTSEPEGKAQTCDDEGVGIENDGNGDRQGAAEDDNPEDRALLLRPREGGGVREEESGYGSTAVRCKVAAGEDGTWPLRKPPTTAVAEYIVTVVNTKTSEVIAKINLTSQLGKKQTPPSIYLPLNTKYYFSISGIENSFVVFTGKLDKSCTDNRPVYDRVRSINEYLQKTLGVDSDLLASLTTHNLVSDNERELIYSMLQNFRPRNEITACFINNVLYNWPLERFRQHIQVLADILEEHTDAANQCCAQRLKGILN